ncbi:N-acetyltransferase [Christiangramia forsetii]|nr:N-acetyltransferase [Christiangramia forsetii]
MVFQGLSLPGIIKYYGVNYKSFEATEDQMNWYENLEKSGSGQWWVIRSKEDSKFCGAIGYNDFNKEHNKAEIGFWLFPEYWGKGIIQESANILFDYLFEDLKLHRLEAYVESENESSSKTLKNLGFNYEGRMKDCEIKNNEYISIDIYAKIKT